MGQKKTKKNMKKKSGTKSAKKPTKKPDAKPTKKVEHKPTTTTQTTTKKTVQKEERSIGKCILFGVIAVLLCVGAYFGAQATKPVDPSQLVLSTEITNPGDYLEDFKYKRLEVNDITKHSYTDVDVNEKIDEHIKSTVELKDIKTKITEKTPFSFEGKLKADKKEYPIGEELMKMEYIQMDETIKNAFLGKKIGDKVTFQSAITDDKGKQVMGNCEVKITAVKEDPRNYFTDKWVETKQEVYKDCKTTKEFKKLVSKDLEEACTLETNNEIYAQLIEQFNKDVKFKKEPTELIEKEINSTYEMYEMYKAYGIDAEKQIMEEQGFKKKSELEKFIKDTATETVKINLILEYIAEKEGLQATKDEVNELITENQMDANNAADVENARSGVVQKKVVEWLVDHSKVNYLSPYATTATTTE